MVNFCSVSNCLNSSRNRPDLSFFCFPSEQSSRRLWKNFCRRGVSSHEKRLDDRKKRTFHEQCSKPKKSRRVTQEVKDTSVTSNEAVLLHHNYFQLLPNNHKGTQTDFSLENLEVLIGEIDTLKDENAKRKAKVSNK